MTKFKWNTPSEKDIESAILYYLNYQIGVFAFKVDTRANFDPNMGFYRKLDKTIMPGTPDILCCVEVDGIGVFVGFEVKAEAGRQSPKQKQFQERLEVRAKGFYFIVRSVQETIEALEQVKVKTRAAYSRIQTNVFPTLPTA